MRILWVGDAGVSTGFARCTHAVCDALHEAGHEVDVLGINYWGRPDVQDQYPYRLWPAVDPPAGRTGTFGARGILSLVRSLSPDVIVLLNDPWNVEDYIRDLASFSGEYDREIIDQQFKESNIPPIVGWLAIDSENQKCEWLNHLAHVVTWTDFAQREIESGGYEGTQSVVPLGVDHELFKPNDKQAARERFGLVEPIVPEDAFIVGVVGRNQPRKRLDLALQYFSEFVSEYDADNARLYIHTAPTGEYSVDLPSLARFYGLRGKVVVVQTNAGFGMPDEFMPKVYAAMDVYWSTTQGEGWGLTALEAMACGIACQLPDFSGYGSWARDGALLVPCRVRLSSAPQNSSRHTVAAIPDLDESVAALGKLYLDEAFRLRLGACGLEHSKNYSWNRTGNEFVDVLEQFLEPVVSEVASG